MILVPSDLLDQLQLSDQTIDRIKNYEIDFNQMMQAKLISQGMKRWPLFVRCSKGKKINKLMIERGVHQTEQCPVQKIFNASGTDQFSTVFSEEQLRCE